MAETLPDDFPLPPLREDLRIERAAPLATGAAAWVIYDPARHRYFQIGQRVIEILAAWKTGTLKALTDRLKTQSGLTLDQGELTRLLHFLYTNELTQAPVSGRSNEFSARARTAKRASVVALMKAYLFFRIHLLRPERFLDATRPIAAVLYSRASTFLAVLAGVVGLTLVLRQADQFFTYAQSFLSPQGALAIGLALVFVKVFHELGHAYQARFRGVAVPSMGIAFMVMIPLLYTEVSDAWRLRDRRSKLMVDAGGVLVELWLASIATLAWVFLPDGVARIAAFSIATTSWVTSLFINLNPFMRFDGYYFLNDALGAQNLQPRSFAMARWRLRELLFGLGDAPPERHSTAMRRFMVVYAWLTWVYRFFLFLGIALLVYQIFFKALGILLFLIEIFFFIALPVLKEMKEWTKMGGRIVRRPRAWMSAAVLAAGIALLVIPMPVKVRAPAVMGFAEQVDVFPAQAGQLTDLLVAEGDAVQAGQVLARLSSPELENDRTQTELRITLIQRRLDRAVVLQGDRTQRRVLERELAAEQDRLSGQLAEIDALSATAPFDGVAIDVPIVLRDDAWLSRRDRIALLIQPGPAVVRGYLTEADLGRVALGAEGVFVPDDLGLASSAALLVQISDFSAAEISLPELTGPFGGPIAIESADPASSGPEARPTGAWFAMTAELPQSDLRADQTTQRGVVVFDGQRESLAYRMFLQVARVLIRETNL